MEPPQRYVPPLAFLSIPSTRLCCDKQESMKHLCAILFLAAFPVLAADPSIAGTWKLSLAVNGQTYDMACTFQQDGEKLTGVCKSENGENPLTGQFQDQKITWEHQTPYNGDTLTLKYTGALTSATEMKGTLNVQPYDVMGDFTGQKQPADGGK